MGYHIILTQPQFPPTIFYKIYVVRNLVDMCAFSPRNYTLESKQLHPIDLFNKGRKKEVKKENGAWYNRFENNEWRPVLDSVMLDMDHMVIRSAPKTKKFHFLLSERQKRFSIKTSDKGKEWMRVVDELENGMLEWSNMLDFDAYQKKWSEIATTQAVGDI